MVYDEHDRRLFCNCGAYYQDCKHKQLVIKTVTKELKQKRIVNECGSNEAQAIQDQMNGQLDSRNDNGNGAKALSQPMQLDLSNPFEESESYDIDQIEGRCNGELAWKLSNGEYCISYQGIMTLSEKHHITFETATHSETGTVIAKGRCGTSARNNARLRLSALDTVSTIED